MVFISCNLYISYFKSLCICLVISELVIGNLMMVIKDLHNDNPLSAEYFYINHGDQRVLFNSKSS